MLSTFGCDGHRATLKQCFTSPVFCYHTGWDNLYRYTADLLCLDRFRPLHDHTIPALSQVTTPLVIPAWEAALGTHPDKAFVRYISNGLRHGFRVGFQHQSPLRSTTSNMPSALEHPDTVQRYIADELAKGRMLGPVTPDLHSSLHINQFRVIPKGHNTGKWRLITDLSFPEGSSVNDGIEPELCSLSYMTVDDVAKVVFDLGKGTLLGKEDIESAYRLVPVHPQDRVLQAVKWGGKVYVDPMLPFGLRSAPKVFNAVADALNWILCQAGIDFAMHYLDDFVVIGAPGSDQCHRAMTILEEVCKQLGIPLALHKKDGPTTCIVFLGIEIDSVHGELRLPAEKMERLQSLLESWGDKKTWNYNHW